MATRMQQRRGTAAQWTAANPVLAAGEIGFETDTNKFKMGNGTSAWAALTYFANAAELAAIIDGAPAALDTLNELAAALGDNPNFLASLATNTRVDELTLAANTALNGVQTTLDNRITTHESDTTSIHGIADTAELATKTFANDVADSAVNTAVAALTKASVGLSNVDDTQDAFKPVSAAQATAIADAKTEAITAAGQAADDKVSAHNLDETNVHGIADTSVLVTQTELADAITGVTVDQSALAGTGLAWDGVNEKFTVDSTIATKTYADGAVSTHEADSTSVHGISDTSQLAYKNAANQTFTGNMEVDGNLVVDGDFTVNGTNFSASATSITIEDNMLQLAHQNTANTVDLGLVVAYNDGAAKHSGIVRDVSDAKWKLFKGVSTEPSTVVAFGEGSLDDLAVGALEATTVTPSSGIVFSDGTQTKVGVPSITAFATEITSSATLAAGEQDKFVPLNGAVVITLPATGYSTGQSIDFYQATGTGASFASTNGVVGTPGLNFRTTNSVVTAMKTSGGWLIFGDLSA